MAAGRGLLRGQPATPGRRHLVERATCVRAGLASCDRHRPLMAGLWSTRRELGTEA